MNVLVLGGSAEAVELAQAHARLGCRVSLVQPSPNILPGEDLELVDPLRHHLRRDGVDIHENNAVLTAEHAGAGVALRLEGGVRLEGSHLLLALGRTPNLSALDLPAGRIATTPRLYPMRYPFGPAEVVDFFISYYGPTNRAHAALDAEGQAALRADLERLWAGNNRASDGSTQVESEFLEVEVWRA